MTPVGFPHSDIPGSTSARDSPRLFAACHVLHRLLAPRHPPRALCSLTPTAPDHAVGGVRCPGSHLCSRRNRVSIADAYPLVKVRPVRRRVSPAEGRSSARLVGELDQAHGSDGRWLSYRDLSPLSRRFGLVDPVLFSWCSKRLANATSAGWWRRGDSNS